MVKHIWIYKAIKGALRLGVEACLHEKNITAQIDHTILNAVPVK